MDSLTTEDESTPIAAAPEVSDKSGPATEDVDYNRLNNLLTFLNEKLTTDVYGNFYIRGSHTAKDGRNTQLRAVFELKDLLEANIVLMERKTCASAGDVIFEGKKGAKFTLAQLKAIVKEEQQGFASNCSAEFVALKDRFNATEIRLKKSEGENEALKARCEAMEVRLWKSEQASDAMRRQMGSLATKERCAFSAEGQLKKHLLLSQECTQLRLQVATSESRLKVLEKAKEDQAQQERLQAQMRRINGGMSGEASTGIDQISYDDLKKRVALMKERILEVEEWQEQYSADFAFLEENVEVVETTASGAKRDAAKANSKIGHLRRDLAWANENADRIEANQDDLSQWATEKFTKVKADCDLLIDWQINMRWWLRVYVIHGLQYTRPDLYWRIETLTRSLGTLLNVQGWDGTGAQYHERRPRPSSYSLSTRRRR